MLRGRERRSKMWISWELLCFSFRIFLVSPLHDFFPPFIFPLFILFDDSFVEEEVVLVLAGLSCSSGAPSFVFSFSFIFWLSCFVILVSFISSTRSCFAFSIQFSDNSGNFFLHSFSSLLGMGRCGVVCNAQFSCKLWHRKRTNETEKKVEFEMWKVIICTSECWILCAAAPFVSCWIRNKNERKMCTRNLRKFREYLVFPKLKTANLFFCLSFNL